MSRLRIDWKRTPQPIAKGPGLQQQLADLFGGVRGVRISPELREALDRYARGAK